MSVEGGALAPYAAGSWEVVPLTGVGPFRLGMKRAEAERVIASFPAEPSIEAGGSGDRGWLSVDEHAIALDFEAGDLASVGLAYELLPSIVLEGEAVGGGHVLEVVHRLARLSGDMRQIQGGSIVYPTLGLHFEQWDDYATLNVLQAKALNGEPSAPITFAGAVDYYENGVGRGSAPSHVRSLPEPF